MNERERAYERRVALHLAEAWSEAARVAALEARRRKGFKGVLTDWSLTDDHNHITKLERRLAAGETHFPDGYPIAAHLKKAKRQWAWRLRNVA